MSGIQGLLPGSISKFCLQNSPIPVIVVRPNSQRARGKRKRAHDPARQYYRDLLDKTMPDQSVDSLVGVGAIMPAADDEAAAVAKALGIGESIRARSRGRSPSAAPSTSPRMKSPGIEHTRKSPLVQVTSADEVTTLNSLKASSGTTEVAKTPKTIDPANLLVDEAEAKEFIEGSLDSKQGNEDEEKAKKDDTVDKLEAQKPSPG
jgi:hypothetical protein